MTKDISTLRPSSAKSFGIAFIFDSFFEKMSHYDPVCIYSQWPAAVIVVVFCSCRILSIACGSSTSTFAFAAAASSSSSSHLMGGASYLTSSLTSPGLPSSRVLTNEMTQFTRPGMMGRSGTSSLRRGELPTAGGVFIWDLKTQKQKVCSYMYLFTPSL